MSEGAQIALALLVFGLGGIGFLWLADLVMEQVDDHIVRERQWRAIDIQHARERHPSYQVPIYDWAKEVDLQ